MFERLKKQRSYEDMSDIHVYTAKKLSDMAGSLERLARTFREEDMVVGSLSREDGLMAMQTAAAVVCGDCRGCCFHPDDSGDENYYLYYLLRSFEQKGCLDCGDMPRLFQETCRRQEEYVGHLNRNLGRATMNLNWKNRFLESRDVIITQFRELAVILEEFSRQIGQAEDVTKHEEARVHRYFQKNHMEISRMLILRYAEERREAFLTVRTTNGRCVTSKDAADCLGHVVEGPGWVVAQDSRSIVSRQFSTIRFLENGSYQMICGFARRPKNGEAVSGDNFTFNCVMPGHVIMCLSDGMGSGGQADGESRRVIELIEQLLTAGYAPRSALKMVNAVLLLMGEEQHPATIDLCCVNLYSGVLEAMKLGAPAAFVSGDSGVEIIQACAAPAGILNPVEPEILSWKLWENDRIVMVSDGVLDSLPGDDKERTMKEYLEGTERRNPQVMAEAILGFAAENSKEFRDDMTVLVAGIWKRQKRRLQ